MNSIGPSNSGWIEVNYKDMNQVKIADLTDMTQELTPDVSRKALVEIANFMDRRLDERIRNAVTGLSLRALAQSRSALFLTESFMLPAIEFAVNRKRPRLPFDDRELFQNIRSALEQLIDEDIKRIERGVYPAQVLKIESPLSHLKRLPSLLIEGVKASARRKKKSARQFGDEAKTLLRGLPEYYQRNFHFQPDGYLSDLSAELYEHQVEVLFGGAADSMRRLIIEPLREHFGSSDGDGLKFLEVAAGTGRSTSFVRLAFPLAKIVALDLSAPYLKRAQVNLKSYPRHDFVEGDAAATPFRDEEFDAVYSVFLFHELPERVRSDVIKESVRVLKPGGFWGFVDSLQLGDRPEFDEALKLFPVEYHEPFYRNYIETSLDETIQASGLQIESRGTGFFSKVIAAKKNLA